MGGELRQQSKNLACCLKKKVNTLPPLLDLMNKAEHIEATKHRAKEEWEKVHAFAVTVDPLLESLAEAHHNEEVIFFQQLRDVNW